MDSLAVENLRQLVCPVCCQSLQLEENAIRCQGCGRGYPILDGILILLVNDPLTIPLTIPFRLTGRTETSCITRS